MNILNSYVTFLQEYKKLLERGVKDIFAKTVAPSFIWLDEIEMLIDDNLCETTLTDFFIGDYENIKSNILSLDKPLKPEVNIPNEYIGIIEFNDAKNKFESEDENELISFKNSEFGTKETSKIQRYKGNKALYSKLYRAYNDIKNDSNIEIVLSVGLIQHSKQGNGKTSSISKTNQHLFHFPLKIELTITNKINLSFSEIEKPYVDFFFLNNLPIEKTALSNIVDRFEEEIETNGFQYIYDKKFKDLIAKNLQQISENSTFESIITKPLSDTVNTDSFKFTFSPSINIKKQKPRFFDKLTKGIIEENENDENSAELFNLLIRNPENAHTNSHVKPNYFIDELYEEHKENNTNLNAEQDFSVFFPLPYNKEQKQIYDNYLKNRITVVTGPPGTGKSHTIVNILCSLLAQGKRVLVTAQTDKALESLLDKIPQNFDDLVFTKIQLEVDKTRFSLEKSINNIRSILIDDFNLNIEKKISNINILKGEYLQYKSEIHKVLEKEYNEVSLNDSFKDLRSYGLWDKFQSKNDENWNWIKDEITLEIINAFVKIKKEINTYKQLYSFDNLILKSIDFDLKSILEKINDFNFTEYLNRTSEIEKLKSHLDIDEISKSKLLKIDLNSVTETTEKYSNADIIINSYQQISQLKNKLIKKNKNVADINSNLKYSEIVENSSKYLRDIESFLAQIESGKEKIGFLAKFKAKYKQVSYLENIVLNSKNCDNKTSLNLLKVYLKEIQEISSNINNITKAGFDIVINEDSDLSSKCQLLNTAIEQVERNFSLVDLLQKDKDIINFSKIFNIEISNVEEIYTTSVSYKEDLEKLKDLELSAKKDISTLKAVSNTFLNSNLLNDFSEFIPLENISETVKFKEFQTKLEDTLQQADKENQFNNSKSFIEKILPKTLPFLLEIPIEKITKENFEFAHANQYFKQNEIIDLQKTKEKLSQINDRIYEQKSEILFDLAKNNFKSKFDSNQINEFINLLEDYKTNLYQGSRGIKDKVKFQVLARKNSAEISNKLSCWVMKFNDVLNSVSTKPEVFDCVIVDEASQLDFNSLILGYYAKNMIIVGDDKQTSPSALTGANDNDFQSIKNKYLEFLGDNRIQIRSDESLFSLSKKAAGSSSLALKEHFRCVSEIIEFSKYNFYENSLKPLKQINTVNRLVPVKAVFVQNSFLEDKIVYTEIESIKKHLIEIINNPIYQNKTIGVVSLGLVKHTEKLKDIKEDLSELFGRDKLDEIKLIIEDSPKFQGDERDVMLVSLGVALDYEKLKNEGIEKARPRSIVDDGNLKDDFKKINVALSRAKEQMILFHSVKSENLRNNDFRLKILSFFYNETKELKPFELPDNENERNLYNIPKPFDSWFEYDITSDLINQGYQFIQPQYKVKEDETFYNHRIQRETYVNFKLDLVVSNNGKMIAIECDGDPFHSLPEDVAYDVERQEFLERVGWKVYRVLYSAYKRSPSTEIEKMVNFIERYTKKDKVIPIAKVFNETPREEIQQKTTSYTHKSFIDKLEDDLNHQNEKIKKSINKIEKSQEDKILRFFNLKAVGTYTLEKNKSDTSIYSLPLYEKDKNGYLLLGYTNGHLNKVSISNLLTKKINKIYQNGFNIQASLAFLKIAKKDDILGLYFEEKGIKKFKAHLIENVTSHKYLFAKGNKVIYKDYKNLKYEIFQIEQLNNIKRLVYQSFSATGKALDNSNYEKEWKTINPKKNLEIPFDTRQIESLIQKAIAEKKNIKVLYKNKEGQESERILSNLEMIIKKSHSGYIEILKADCSLRGAERHFKIERIKNVEIL
ncbi:AAA family ATPase [Leeuwenhoekiella marinoflava]|uniref:Superfamily I DNA and/or RNA helicase n=2 Tax=Leeuwenhoekiella marinoflava TaxID=988 RepID=A0A4Q0PKN7_9FLAO|nr:AAA family ATPase [Leeuwenhoekiella marinoflava]RXG29012.1 superfamily I DNA and/or RNA helicase [Leeuwenhoekiella marinoflava]SHF45456.1 Superfamily I DNA and/or RNA helicase [Leeuwenhoekiella marinoflava DSM 3653]